MDLEHHTPSLTHLRTFVRDRSAGRPTHLFADRQQVSASTTDRAFAFAYEKFISGVTDFVAAGSRGGELERAVANSSLRMRPSYAAAAKGMKRLIADLAPISVSRRQRSVVVVVDDVELVSLRIHLLFDLPSGERLCAFLYFSQDRLTSHELSVMETSIALASAQIDPSATPALVSVRSGDLLRVSSAATAPPRIAFLTRMSAEYREAWAASA
jgi:hypothetical protein